MDEIVYALPKEKDITVFKAVDDEFKSKAASEHVKKGFLEIVSETIETVVDGTVEIVHTIADTVRDIKDWIDDMKSSWWPF